MTDDNNQDLEPVTPDLKNIVEAAILASDGPVTPRALQELFPASERPERAMILEAVEALRAECDGRGVELVKVGGGYRYHTRESLAPWLRKLREQRPPRYSRALLETLAIIAYQQPVTRGDIEDIRGVAVSSDIMRVLQEREWVRQVGVKDVPGRPGLYGTTEKFLEYFNLGGLRELPALPEQRDIMEIANELKLPASVVQPAEESGENTSPDHDDDSDSSDASGSDESHGPVTAADPDNDTSETVQTAQSPVA